MMFKQVSFFTFMAFMDEWINHDCADCMPRVSCSIEYRVSSIKTREYAHFLVFETLVFKLETRDSNFGNLRMRRGWLQ